MRLALACRGRRRCHHGLAGRCFEFDHRGRHHDADHAIVDLSMWRGVTAWQVLRLTRGRSSDDLIAQNPHNGAALVHG